jgi:predicted RNA-binding protein YlqC (UPF0109 family)
MLTSAAQRIVDMTRALLGALVKHPDAIVIEAHEAGDQLSLFYRGHYQDVPRLVGSGGKTATATLRVIQMAGAMLGVNVFVRLLDPEGGKRPVAPTPFVVNHEWQPAPLRDALERILAIVLPHPSAIEEMHFRNLTRFHVRIDKRDYAVFNIIEPRLSLLANAAGKCHGRFVLLETGSGDFTVTEKSTA